MIGSFLYIKLLFFPFVLVLPSFFLLRSCCFSLLSCCFFCVASSFSLLAEVNMAVHPSWLRHGPSWLHLGPMLDHLGSILSHLGSTLAPSWANLPPPRIFNNSTRQKCIPYSTSATWTPQNCIPYSTLLFRGCKSAIRYCKVLFRGAKSAIRYALFENRWPPLWGRSDLGSLKHNTHATFFLTLHSLWGPSDFFLQQYHISAPGKEGTQNPLAWFALVWPRLAWFGSGKSPPQRA